MRRKAARTNEWTGDHQPPEFNAGRGRRGHRCGSGEAIRAGPSPSLVHHTSCGPRALSPPPGSISMGLAWNAAHSAALEFP